MEDKRATAKQTVAEVDIDVEHMAQKVAEKVFTMLLVPPDEIWQVFEPALPQVAD